MEIEEHMQNRIIETKETIAKSNETKSWFFEKIKNVDKPLASFQEKKGANSDQ